MLGGIPPPPAPGIPVGIPPPPPPIAPIPPPGGPLAPPWLIPAGAVYLTGLFWPLELKIGLL